MEKKVNQQRGRAAAMKVELKVHTYTAPVVVGVNNDDLMFAGCTKLYLFSMHNARLAFTYYCYNF